MAEGQTAAADGDSDDIVAKLKLRMIEHALPLWSGEGWDRDDAAALSTGSIRTAAPIVSRRGAFSCRPGRSIASPRRRRWAGIPQGREIALKGLDYLLTKAKAPDGRPGFVQIADARWRGARPAARHL